jgi:large subunit ribosomal protein L34
MVRMSKTYNPKKLKRKKTHGFLARASSTPGRAVVRRRRQKGRVRLTVK